MITRGQLERESSAACDEGASSTTLVIARNSARALCGGDPRIRSARASWTSVCNSCIARLRCDFDGGADASSAWFCRFSAGNMSLETNGWPQNGLEQGALLSYPTGAHHRAR